MNFFVKSGFLKNRNHNHFTFLFQTTDSSVAKICCVTNPCNNEAECVLEIRSGKKTFSCKCLPGFTGRFCDVKVRAYQDYLRANESAVSELYEIWLNVPTLSKTVYCYFDHVNLEVWTLVMSYSYSHQNDMGIHCRFTKIIQSMRAILASTITAPHLI